MSVFRIGDLFARLMTDELEYKRFAVRATDLGTGVALQLVLVHSNYIIGLHLSGANPRSSVSPPQDLSEAEKKFVADIQDFWTREGAYAMMHATKPQTLAYGLNDFLPDWRRGLSKNSAPGAAAMANWRNALPKTSC